MEQNFYDNGLHFDCQRCSYCCGHSPGFVYLSKRDLLTLCSYFNLNIDEFVKKYCRWAGYYEGKTVLALFEKKNFDCILWNNGCSAYEARPVQCSPYPFWSWMIADKNTWNECAQDCPGMNRGRLWSKEQIVKAAKQSDENIPITKEEVMLLINAQQER